MLWLWNFILAYGKNTASSSTFLSFTFPALYTPNSSTHAVKPAVLTTCDPQWLSAAPVHTWGNH